MTGSDRGDGGVVAHRGLTKMGGLAIRQGIFRSKGVDPPRQLSRFSGKKLVCFGKGEGGVVHNNNAAPVPQRGKHTE